MSTTSSAIPTSTASVRSSNSSQCPNNKRQRVEPNDESSSNSGLNSSTSSLTTITTDLSLILWQFECCVCLDYITPPILQCPNAHLFCQTCRQNLRTPVKCPECREPLPTNNMRCHPMEQIAVNLGLLFPCKYSSSGCSFTSILTEKKEHENQCEFRPYRCHRLCQWSGDKLNWIQHLIDVHNFLNRDLDSHNLIFNITEYATCKFSRWSELLSFKGQHFVFLLKRNPEERNEHIIVNFKAIVLFFGEQRDANHFKYRISMSDHSNGLRLYFEEKPQSVRESARPFLLTDNLLGLAFDENLIKKFTKKANFEFKLNITDEDNKEYLTECQLKSDLIIPLTN